MGLRFRKTISLGKGVHLNFSKKGAGVSIGGKGIRIGTSTKGVYTSMGIPGSGIYSINYLGKRKGGDKKMETTKNKTASDTLFTLLILAILILVFIYLPMFGVTLLVIGLIIYYLLSRRSEKRAERKLKKALELFNNGNYENAIGLLTDAWKLDNKNIDIVYLLGISLYSIGDYDKAIEYIKHAIYHKEDNPILKFILSECLYNVGKYDEAIITLQKLPDEMQRKLEFINLLGLCFMAKEEYDLAIDVFKRAPLRSRTINEKLMEIYYNLAIAYDKNGDKKNSQKFLRKIYSNDVNYKDVQYRLKLKSEEGKKRENEKGDIAN